MFTPYWAAALADAYGRNAQPSEGLATIAYALDHVAQTEERNGEAELYRMNGRILCAEEAADLPAATACFNKAIEVAQSQNAKMWELRATPDLAHLWDRQGKRNEVRALLMPLYDWFSEGFDTADLINAKTLLDDLA